jgi:hypothetical protein
MRMATATRRGRRGRFLLALLAAAAAYQYGFVRALSFGARAFGLWGMVAALVAFALVLTLLFTAVYDGPRALAALLRRRQPRRA